jgi:hypothetical protein
MLTRETDARLCDELLQELETTDDTPPEYVPADVLDALGDGDVLEYGEREECVELRAVDVEE